MKLFDPHLYEQIFRAARLFANKTDRPVWVGLDEEGAIYVSSRPPHSNKQGPNSNAVVIWPENRAYVIEPPPIGARPLANP